MRVASLVSGGKDSLLALHKTSHEVVCLITALSDNPDSYMFHTDAVKLTKLQVESMGLPLIAFNTRGIKEEELKDLRAALLKAKEEYDIKGVVSGAIESNYQKKRIDDLCKDLDLASISPLWGQDPLALLREVARDFKAIIVKVAADGLDASWLGRVIDASFINDILKLKVHPMGEGGEYESLVLNAPLFKKELVIKSTKEWDGVVGHLRITSSVLRAH
jgi:ABC transporter with metal-binding/Fe-S-binding domain ATP-binding protein